MQDFMILFPWVICGLYSLCHFGKHYAMLRFVLNIWCMVVPFMPTNAPLAGCRCKDAALLFGGQRALLCVYIFMWWPFQDVNTVMAMCGGGSTSGRGLFLLSREMKGFARQGSHMFPHDIALFFIILLDFLWRCCYVVKFTARLNPLLLPPIATAVNNLINSLHSCNPWRIHVPCIALLKYQKNFSKFNVFQHKRHWKTVKAKRSRSSRIQDRIMRWFFLSLTYYTPDTLTVRSWRTYTMSFVVVYTYLMN